MKTNRRNFIKTMGLTGVGLSSGGVLRGATPQESHQDKNDVAQASKLLEQARVQRFNMSGFAAPPLEKVRIAIIGLGQRGPAHLNIMRHVEGTEIRALCDIRPEKANAAKKNLAGTAHNPEVFTGPEDWKKVCERDDIDLVMITTPWYMHTMMAVYAMEHGKHVASEVPAAGTIEECWRFVETAERTRRHCMMMENDSYLPFQLMTLNMARQSFFGEVVHADCAYNTSKMKNNFSKNMYWEMWWLKQYAARRGNMNVTTLRTTMGRTIMLQHDATSPSPHNLFHGIYDTKGAALYDPQPPRLCKGNHAWVSAEEFKALEEKYTAKITRLMTELAAKTKAGHGGSDLLEDWRLIDCLRNGLPLDQDVYDAAAWSAVVPLSEWSVLNRSNSVEIPDFTAGAWKTNQLNMDINLEKGGSTKVLV